MSVPECHYFCCEAGSGHFEGREGINHAEGECIAGVDAEEVEEVLVICEGAQDACLVEGDAGLDLGHSPFQKS